MSNKEIIENLQRIDSYLVEKYKNKCPADVFTVYNGLYFTFNLYQGIRLLLTTDCSSERCPLSEMSLGQLSMLAEALPKIEENILAAEATRTAVTMKTLNLLRDFESKQNGL